MTAIASHEINPPAPQQPVVVESSPEDLAAQRYLLDLALQPVDSFTGFTRLEQIGGSALRYQLNYACYGLSTAQYTRTPAFTGYLQEAQANLIRKMCDKRVWGYWAAERLAGYLRWNPDPMVFANVMYTGFFATMLAFYETLNDDRGFHDDGSLPLVWNRRTRYDYGFGSIAGAIEKNMRDSKVTLYPCEPHLIYPMCNAVAVVGLKGYDRLHDADLTGDLVEQIRDSFHRNGFITPGGRFRFGLGPAGLKLPPTLSNDAVMTYWLNCVMPDLANDTWEILRERRIWLRNGRAELLTAPIDNLDVGSYRMGDAWAWTNVAIAALEMGDDEVADAVTASIDERFETEVSPSGAHKLEGVSTWANCAHAFSRFVSKDSLRGLANGEVPAEWRSGPILEAAPYPDLLVAKAVTDGRALDVVFRPGMRPVRTTVKVGRLIPGRRYKVSGAVVTELVPGADGTALVDITVSRRYEFRVEPLA
ncbi:linalool dehydratase/isomerase domain-containing protein [Gordonia rhizosphera]|uniref:Linalool dehydratase/isomerase domain-containing protein n=1 Tax=Gordonia rhizosphera NBRC 16068 TaxID=1108045 RepID=K6X1D9_9ACTN|nr:hypothetical protein [Gordonia rhizosphera]GAB92624.1 hypothetical protein GORHZ_185_00400 [Gordonia rhizosphera NBRC 16068]